MVSINATVARCWRSSLLAIVDGKDGEIFPRFQRTGQQRDITVFLVLAGAGNLRGGVSGGCPGKSAAHTLLTPTSMMLTLMVGCNAFFLYKMGCERGMQWAFEGVSIVLSSNHKSS